MCRRRTRTPRFPGVAAYSRNPVRWRYARYASLSAALVAPLQLRTIIGGPPERVWFTVGRRRRTCLGRRAYGNAERILCSISNGPFGSGRFANAKRPLGRSELKALDDWNDGQPTTELNFKFYRQA